MSRFKLPKSIDFPTNNNNKKKKKKNDRKKIRVDTCMVKKKMGTNIDFIEMESNFSYDHVEIFFSPRLCTSAHVCSGLKLINYMRSTVESKN